MIDPRIDMVAFQRALHAAQLASGLSWREVADCAGVRMSTVMRMRDDAVANAVEFETLRQWVGIPVEALIPSSPPVPQESGMSVYIAAHSSEDARRLFDKCMAMAATGERYNGELVWAEPQHGCAQLYTHLSNGAA